MTEELTREQKLAAVLGAALCTIDMGQTQLELLYERHGYGGNKKLKEATKKAISSRRLTIAIIHKMAAELGVEIADPQAVLN